MASLAASNRRLLLWPAVALLLVVASDQVTKIWAAESLAASGPVRVLGDFLMFTLVYNEGGALGTRIGPASYYLVASFLIMLFVLYYTWANRRQLAISLPLATIAGGAIGNIIDRLRVGQVVDFIDVDFFDINLFGYHLERFWTFNIADAAISCSIVYLILSTLFRHRDADQPDTANTSAGTPPQRTGENLG